MPLVTYVDHGGGRHSVDVPVGDCVAVRVGGKKGATIDPPDPIALTRPRLKAVTNTISVNRKPIAKTTAVGNRTVSIVRFSTPRRKYSTRSPGRP